MMRVLADADLVYLLFYLCDHKDAERLLEIAQSDQVQVYVVYKCLKRIIKDDWNASRVDAVISCLEDKKIKVLRIENSNPQIKKAIKKAREKVTLSDWDSRAEIAYAIALNFGAIVTHRPEDFAGVNLLVWSVDQLEKLLKLEEFIIDRKIEQPDIYFEEKLRQEIKEAKEKLIKLVGLRIYFPDWLRNRLSVATPHMSKEIQKVKYIFSRTLAELQTNKQFREKCEDINEKLENVIKRRRNRIHQKISDFMEQQEIDLPISKSPVSVPELKINALSKKAKKKATDPAEIVKGGSRKKTKIFNQRRFRNKLRNMITKKFEEKVEGLARNISEEIQKHYRDLFDDELQNLIEEQKDYLRILQQN